MAAKLWCIEKHRNEKGKILYYTLQDEMGRTFNTSDIAIRCEMAGNLYEFVNLQIDKAGRLVDKATKEKRPTERVWYSLEDLIRYKNPKGKKIRFYDRESEKSYEGIGTNFWTINGSDGMHNAIYVYVEKVGKEFLVRIDTKNKALHDQFITDYNRSMPPYDGEGYYSRIVEQEVDWLNRTKIQYKPIFVSQKGIRVDVKANPEGQYTVVEIGQYKEEYWETEYNMEAYKIRDNKTGKVCWVRSLYDGIDVNKNHNAFTNVYMKMGDLHINRENVQCKDCNLEMKLFRTYKTDIKEIFKEAMESGTVFICMNENLYSISGDAVEKLKELEKTFIQISNTKEMFNIFKESFEDILNETLSDIVDIREVNGKAVYFVGLADEEVYMSTDKNAIKKCYDGYISDMKACGMEVHLDSLNTNLEM